jgi:hypothetical protein
MPRPAVRALVVLLLVGSCAHGADQGTASIDRLCAAAATAPGARHVQAVRLDFAGETPHWRESTAEEIADLDGVPDLARAETADLLVVGDRPALVATQRFDAAGEGGDTVERCFDPAGRLRRSVAARASVAAELTATRTLYRDEAGTILADRTVVQDLMKSRRTKPPRLAPPDDRVVALADLPFLPVLSARRVPVPPTLDEVASIDRLAAALDEAVAWLRPDLVSADFAGTTAAPWTRYASEIDFRRKRQAFLDSPEAGGGSRVARVFRIRDGPTLLRIEPAVTTSERVTVEYLFDAAGRLRRLKAERSFGPDRTQNRRVAHFGAEFGTLDDRATRRVGDGPAAPVEPAQLDVPVYAHLADLPFAVDR